MIERATETSLRGRATVAATRCGLRQGILRRPPIDSGDLSAKRNKLEPR